MYWRSGITIPKSHIGLVIKGEFAEEDDETGWNQFELRLYDGVVGRWLSVDPYRQYWSPYVGMGNDPVNLIDPDGGCTTGDCNGIEGYVIGEVVIADEGPLWLKMKRSIEGLINDVKNTDFVFEVGAKAELGLAAKIKLANMVKAGLNIASTTIFDIASDFTEGSVTRSEYLGDGTGIEIKHGVGLELASPIKGTNSSLVVSGSWETSQRVHRVTTHVWTSSGYESDGVQWNVFMKMGSKGGFLNKTGSDVKGGKINGCSCITGSIGAMVILGIEVNFNIGVKN